MTHGDRVTRARVYAALVYVTQRRVWFSHLFCIQVYS